MVHSLAPRIRPTRGFFVGRRAPDYGVGLAGRSGLINYANVSPLLGMVVSSGLATMRELQFVYGLEDCYTLAEIVLVDAHNRIAAGRRNEHH